MDAKRGKPDKSGGAGRGTYQKVGECLYRYSSTGVYYAWFEARGKQIRKSLGTTDRALARRFLGEMQKTLSAGRAADTARATLRGHAEAYLATCSWQKPSSLGQKKRIFVRLMADFPGGGDVRIAHVTASALETWLSLYSHGPSCYNVYLLFLRGVFRLAVNDRVLYASPVDALKPRKLQKPIRDTPTVSEFELLLADVRGQRRNADAVRPGGSADFLEWIGRSGMGRAETANLTWADVDLSAGLIRTFRVKTSRGFTVPIFPRLRPLVERLHAAALASLAGAGPAGSSAVADIKKALGASCARLGIPGYGHRAFRRMFITDALQRGVDVKTVAAWQGRRDGGKLILDTCSHVIDSHSTLMAQQMT